MADRMAKASILIVEDDDEIRGLIAEYLQDAGYTVYIAPDCKPALERLRTHPEGLLVLLDLMMPGMDGVAVLQAVAMESPIATEHAYILLSATTKYHSFKVADSFKHLNVTTLPKPFEIDGLLAAVQEAAGKIR